MNKLKPIRVNPTSKAVLVLTPKDLYVTTESKDDDWLFGYNIGKVSVVSNARMKRHDDQPSNKVEVADELYLKRVIVLALHEIGHDIVKGNHFQSAVWINSQTGYELPLGPHCIDNRCAMYEVVSIKTPSREEGHLRLGKEMRFDAGLDDVISKLNQTYLCDKCHDSKKIDSSYR